MKTCTVIVTIGALFFAFAATAYGGATLTLTANPAPAPGLESYMVTAVSTDASNLVTFSDIHIDDPVHNVWGYANDPVTTMADDFIAEPFLKAWWQLYDTHLLVPESDIFTHTGSSLDEGNDGSNPAGLWLELDPPFGAFVPVVGVGTYGHGEGDSSFTLSLAAQATSVDLLQVVLVEGTKAPLTLAIVNDQMERSELGMVIPEPAPGDANGDGKVTDADYTIWADTYNSTTDLRADWNNSGDITDADYTIWADNYGSGTGSVPVPEPATLGLLLLGGLALLRCRRFG